MHEGSVGAGGAVNPQAAYALAESPRLGHSANEIRQPSGVLTVDLTVLVQIVHAPVHGIDVDINIRRTTPDMTAVLHVADDTIVEWGAIAAHDYKSRNVVPGPIQGAEDVFQL